MVARGPHGTPLATFPLERAPRGAGKGEQSMQVPLEISTRWIDLSPPLEAELRKRADRLERHSGRITSCRIAVERPTGNHHQEGGPYRVRVDVTVPGSELVADKSDEEIYAAIRGAFDAAERQVEAWAAKRRGDVKSRVLPPEGPVVRIFRDERSEERRVGKECRSRWSRE